MRRPLDRGKNPDQDKSKIGRREFIGTTGTVAVAAASWWALTEKTDALAQVSTTFTGGTDPGGQNYDYDEG